MKYDGPGLFVNAIASGSSRGATLYKVEPAQFDLPSVLEIGLSYRVSADEHNSVDIGGTFQNNNYAYDEYRVGFEYGYDQMLFLRGGYLMGAASTDARPQIFQDFTVGAGVNIKGSPEISFDYAYVPVKFFNNNHVISVRVGF